MEAVILIGIQGAGKTTFYRERFVDTHVRISLDMLRTRRRERILLDACLTARQPLVIDNTNVSIKERSIYIEAAKRSGFRVVGYYFDPDLKASLDRNRKRNNKVIPEKGVRATFKRLEPPRIEEGFTELYLVQLDENATFTITEM
jgi:predicted kinase